MYGGTGLYEGIHAEERFVMGDDGRIQQKLVDVTNATKRVAFLDEDKVFETERAAREHARDICDALHVKFAALRDEHDDWLKAHPDFKAGDRVEDWMHDAATVIAFTKSGNAVIEYDDAEFDVADFPPNELTKIED